MVWVAQTWQIQSESRASTVNRNGGCESVFFAICVQRGTCTHICLRMCASNWRLPLATPPGHISFKRFLAQIHAPTEWASECMCECIWVHSANNAHNLSFGKHAQTLALGKKIEERPSIEWKFWWKVANFSVP